VTEDLLASYEDLDPLEELSERQGLPGGPTNLS
jgi:hypothetical protein